MPIRYLVSDLDGTLLDGRSEISPYTLDVLHRAQAAGIGVVAASGRMVASMMPFVRALRTPLPIIACNGALIADSADGTILRSDCVSVEVAREVAMFLETVGCYFQCYDGQGFFYAEQTGESVYYHQATRLPGRSVGRLSVYIQQETPKMLIIAAPREITGLLPDLQARFGGRLSVTNSQPNMIEITNRTATKGAALCALCARLEIDLAEVAAFGDGGNDVTMLAAAGLGVAMENAQPLLKEVAARICGPHTEDGLARFVEQHILGGLA